MKLPKGALALMEQANAKAGEGKFQEAANLMSAVLSRHMEHPMVIHNLACTFAQMKQNGLAANLYMQAIQQDPSFAVAYGNLAACLNAEDQNDLAQQAAAKAVALEPGNAELWNIAGCMNINNGTPEACIAACDKALAIEPGHPDGNYNRGLAHMELSRWREGWKGYKWRFKANKHTARHHWARSSVPMWTGQKNKRVVVYGEQGLGDEVLFSTCLPDLVKDSEYVCMDMNQRLDALMIRSYPDVFTDPTRYGDDEGHLEWARELGIQYKIPIGDLPFYYRNDNEDFPQKCDLLKPDPVKVAKWKEWLPDGFNVAISWAGGTMGTNYTYRTMMLSQWRPILDSGANCFSVQYHDFALGEAEKNGVVHVQEAASDLDEQVAFAAACDLVVTVNQTLVHLSGAAGLKTWTLTPSRPAWRYGLTGETMIWYPSVRQWRQAKDEPWSEVIKRVANELKQEVKNAGDSRPRAESDGSGERTAD